MATTPRLVTELSRMQRVARRPRHTFNLRTRPWQIQPFMIAPVLPGETMKNLFLQCRTVTDPIKNPLIGWWLEHYFFYVKHRDLDGRDDYVEMMLDIDKDMSAYNATAVPSYYEVASGIGWVGQCLKRVVEEYFRDKDEAWDNVLIPASGGLPAAKVRTEESWLDSLLADAAFPTRDLDTETGDVLTAETFDRNYQNWLFMRQQGMTQMTYEDYLATYGVKKYEQEPHKPELLRVLREWQYPTNTVDPADGTPRSAVSWAISDRADKDRRFTEPGFVFGVQIARPKVYLGNQRSTAVSMLSNAFAWLPAIMRDDPGTSLREFASGAGPLGGVAGAYWVDLRDLFLYGDQFLNFDHDSTTATGADFANAVQLPLATTFQHKYAAEGDAAEMFVDETTKRLIRTDGVVQLVIMGRETDQT